MHPTAAITTPALLGTDAKVLRAAVLGWAAHTPGALTKGIWVRLSSGLDSVQRIPAERFDVDAAREASQELLYTRHGHFVQGAELFEPALFGMSVAEVRATDPSHRVLLEDVYSAIVQAGYSRSSLLGTTTGMLLGICNVADWTQLQRDRIGSTSSGVHGAHGSDGGAAAGRVSYLFGLKGPCFSVNTACSSSLVALDAACQNLRLGTCGRSLVAGVCLHLHGSSFAAFCALHALSVDGLCKTFDSRADGYGRSEGCGAMLLEQSRSGTGTAVVGSSTNQDGKSASLMAPNGPSQQEVIAAALAVAGLRSIHLVEAHGTGTALGDPIEVGALYRVLTGSVDHPEPAMLGSFKSQMAHSEGAAGMMGLVKAALGLGVSSVAPNLHLATSNPKLGLTEFEVVLASECTAPPRWLHHVGLSSFGYAGTNSHAVLGNSDEASVAAQATLHGVVYRHSIFGWWGGIELGSNAGRASSIVTDPDGSRTRWERSWPTGSCSYIAQHRVGWTPVMPGTGYLCLAIRAASESEQAVAGARFMAMLVLDGEVPVLVRASKCDALPEQLSIEASVAHGEWTEHAAVALAPPGGGWPSR